MKFLPFKDKAVHRLIIYIEEALSCNLSRTSCKYVYINTKDPVQICQGLNKMPEDSQINLDQMPGAVNQINLHKMAAVASQINLLQIMAKIVEVKTLMASLISLHSMAKMAGQINLREVMARMVVNKMSIVRPISQQTQVKLAKVMVNPINNRRLKMAAEDKMAEVKILAMAISRTHNRLGDEIKITITEEVQKEEEFFLKMVDM